VADSGYTAEAADSDRMAVVDSLLYSHFPRTDQRVGINRCQRFVDGRPKKWFSSVVAADCPPKRAAGN
jgi:hypothetical protein